jgi:hypothetical protein
MKRKEFKDTPHFGSLPQGERRDGRKKFKSTPHPCPLPRGGEGRRKMKRFLTSPHPTLSSKVEREDKGIRI